jgi:hypothetical protein
MTFRAATTSRYADDSILPPMHELDVQICAQFSRRLQRYTALATHKSIDDRLRDARALSDQLRRWADTIACAPNRARLM